MKKKISIIFILLLTGMGVCACTVNLNEKQQEAADAEQMGEQNESIGKTDVTESVESVTAGEISHQISGYELVDGNSLPVTVTFTLKDMQRGEGAYEALVAENPSLVKPQEGTEYIVVTMQVSYDEGEVETLYLAKNEASLPSAKLYFALSNGESNAEDLTESMANSIYNLELQKGESKEGIIVFLHNTDSEEPLYFIGFENVIEFNLKK